MTTDQMLVVRDPKDLVSQNFKLLPQPTLENSEEFFRWQQEIKKWIERLPGLRTPRVGFEGGTPPRDHQIRHSAIAVQRRHNFFSWTMGTGKTALSILTVLLRYGDHLFKDFDWPSTDEEKLEAFTTFKSTMRPGTIHIVGPKHTLRQVWLKELDRMNLSQFAEVIESESQLLNSKAPIFIYHYDFTKLQTDKGNQLKKSGGGIRLKEGGGTYFCGQPMAKIIAKHRPPSYMIIDEIHRLREGTERTRCMKIIRRKSKRVTGLTGTPMDGWVHQMATLLGFIYGEESQAYPFTNADFSRKYTRNKIVDTSIVTGTKEVGKEKPVPGVNHMQIPSFIRSTRHLMHRLNLTDDEVRANVVYPAVKTHKVLIPMDIDQQIFYTELHSSSSNTAKIQLANGYSKAKLRQNMLTLMNGLRLASVAPWALGYSEIHTGMTRTIVEIVKRHAAEGRKGLIGTSFIEESRYIFEALKKSGVNGVRLYATDDRAAKRTMSADQREESIEVFQEDPDCKFLISNKELVAEGLNLAETASYTISCSHGYRANVESQWLARVVRPGQVWSHVDAYTLLNSGTVDIYIYELLQAKLAATAGLIDLDFSISAEDLSNAIDPIVLAEMLTKGDEGA